MQNMQNMCGNKQVLLFFSQLSQIDFCVEMGLKTSFSFYLDSTTSAVEDHSSSGLW